MNLNFLGREALRVGLLLLRILTISLVAYSVLMEIPATFDFIVFTLGVSLNADPDLFIENLATLGFALLFGVRRTLFTIFLIVCFGIWDFKSSGEVINASTIFLYMPQVRPMLFGIVLALGYRHIVAEHERSQRAIEMRERNRRLAIIKGLHDGTAKRLTQTLIHIRTNPPVDPEVVNLLDTALNDLRNIIAETDALYEHADGRLPQQTKVELTTLETMLEDYEVIINDRNLTIDVRPSLEEFPMLPVCTSELINNAVKYAKANSTIVISAGMGARNHSVQVENQVPNMMMRQGSQIGLQTTQHAFNKIGASFTTFNDGECFRATVLLPTHLGITNPPPDRAYEILNIFSEQIQH